MDRKAQRKSVHARKSRGSRFALGAVSLVAALAVVGFGVGFASADKSPESSVEFGLTTSASTTSSVGQLSASDKSAGAEQATVSFSVTKAADSIDAEQAAELERELAAERAAEQACRENALSAEAEWLARSDRPTGLEEVDWSVTKADFVATWGERINDFLAGSNLAGYGETFAEAAWENGIDPRFSAAICNTESGRGSQCFLPYNAWGWGNSSWSNWEEAIWAHAKGLADNYGYAVTSGVASKYCWVNHAAWYATTCYGFENI